MSTLEVVAQSFAMFGAAYPSAKKVDESTVRVWHNGLQSFADDRIKAATKRWIHNEPRYPNLPLFLEMIRSEPAAVEDAWRKQPLCVVCDGGWVEVNTDGRGTVAPCPNGCLPPPVGTIRDEDTAPIADFAWFDAVRKAQQQSEDERRSTSEEGFLRSRGYDPEKFHVQGGMILATVAPRQKPGARKTQIAGSATSGSRGKRWKQIKAAAQSEQRTGEEHAALKMARAQMAVVARRWAVPDAVKVPATDAWKMAETDRPERTQP